LSHCDRAVIDGYGGVFWDKLQDQLRSALDHNGIIASWIDIRAARLPEEQIKTIVDPFLGGDDPFFDTRFTGRVAGFLDKDKREENWPNLQIVIIRKYRSTVGGANSIFQQQIAVRAKHIKGVL